MKKPDWNKYFFSLVITATIFGTALFISNYFSEKRIEEIRSIEERISIDILSLETQFDLLAELSCQTIAENSVLSNELGSLGERLAYMETTRGTDDAEVIRLKRSYTLLQIKDYLLMKKVSEKCGLNPIFIFYFYSNESDCSECQKEGHVLTYLRGKYPTLRVYAFDYNLDLSALHTLITLNNIERNLPALLINNKAYYGYHDIEAIGKIVPSLDSLRDTDESREEE